MKRKSIDSGNNRLLLLIILSILIISLTLIPLYRQSIICNDELLTRFWAGLGFEQFFNHYYNAWITQGRLMAAYVSTVTMYLGFLSQDRGIFKIEQIIVLIICALLFAMLIKVIFKNNKFALLCFISSLVLLPITFEHSVPNAFVSFIGIPTAATLLSIILFVKYLDTGKKTMLIISMSIYFIASASYEVFITIMPIFLILGVCRNVENNTNSKLYGTIWPIITGIFFLGFYILSSIYYPSSYDGNKMVNPIDIPNSLSIIGTLFFDTFPCYYLISPKYQWLMENIGDNVNYLFVLRVVLIIVAYIIILSLLTHNNKHDDNHGKKLQKHLISIITGTLVIILPFIPTSISSMYQHNIGETGFIALPATYVALFGVIFIFCYLAWIIFKNSHSICPKITVVIIAIIIIGPMQLTNDIYSEEQSTDFNRLVYIEDFVKSDSLLSIGGQSYKSPDMYKQYNLLGINDGYWTNYSEEYGNGIEIISAAPQTIHDDRIFFDGSSVFQVWHNESLTLLSKNNIDGKIRIHIIDDEYQDAIITEKITTSDGWFIYHYLPL